MQTSPRRTTPIDLRRLVGSVNQLRFNDTKGEVAFFGQKMIILRRDFLRVMREGLERMVGDQAAPFLSYLASGVGVHEGSIFRDSVTSEGEQARLELENLVHTAFEDTNLGWGKVRVTGLDFAKGRADVAISNCFEALENGTGEKPNCMFTSGFLAGLFAEVFDRTVQANEVKCLSQGAAACEFHVVPLETGEEGKEAGKGEGEKAGGLKQGETKPGEEPTTKTESKTGAGPGVGGKESGKQAVGAAGSAQGDFEAGVERASRIAERKEGFWKRHFGKKD